MLLSKLLLSMYALKSEKLHQIILVLLSRIDGGQMRSKTLRAIFSKYHNIEVGMYSYGGCFDLDHIRPFTTIGRYCSFAENVYVYNANHPFDHKSTHPFFYDPSFGYVKAEQISRKHTEIGNDVWIGQNVIILPSVTQIGDGAVIGAGTVVTKNVPDFAVVVGNPGRVIKYRFSEETIRQLKQERWWDKSIEDLQGNLNAFTHNYSDLAAGDQK